MEDLWNTVETKTCGIQSKQLVPVLFPCVSERTKNEDDLGVWRGLKLDSTAHGHWNLWDARQEHRLFPCLPCGYGLLPSGLHCWPAATTPHCEGEVPGLSEGTGR